MVETLEQEPEDWNDDEDYGDDEGDEDIDAEAEEIARRLGEELWADISKANAERGITNASLPTAAPTIGPDAIPAADPSIHSSRKEEAAIRTMKAILTFLEKDPLALSTLASTTIPDCNGDNVLDILTQTVSSGTIAKHSAMSLSHILVSLARSEVLFGTLRHSNASSIQLDRGKRKREEADDAWHQIDPRASKRPYLPDTDLQSQVTEAVRIITHALGTTQTQTLDPSLVSSIRLQLHQVFLFAVTSSAGGGRDMNALQEISGLIQVIGVLSGIQIGQTPDSHTDNSHAFSPSSVYPWLPGQPPPPTDIGTAVYPCLVAGCRKTFSRLYSLRSHQRVHAVYRPFRCSSCPASFARNHDLKRHIKLHDKKAWKCGGCHKVFSRRDAIKRHKNGSKTRGPKSEACLDAEVVEVELNEEEGEESVREERRAKLWNGIAVNQPSGPPVQSGHHREDAHMEDGEVQPVIIAGIQSAIMSLHGLLQAHVGNALGAPVGQPIHHTDPTNGQATLASVIARAQSQSIPPKASSTPVPLPHQPAASSVSGAPPDALPMSDKASANDNIANLDPGNDEIAPMPSLSMYGLSDEQTRLLEEAIANAAAAAQAQAEAEAALEEEDDVYDQEDEDYDGSETHADMEQPLEPVN